MKHITSRLLALLLTAAMIISMVPAVYAADEDVTIVENEQPLSLIHIFPPAIIPGT